MAKKQDGQRWAEGLVRKAGLAMKKARGNKTARWLSDETAALGYPVSPTVIAKLDSGHRGSVLSVAELLTLAAALNIPPGLLLFPGYPTGEVEFLPGRTADTKAALDWFSGDGRLPTEGRLDAKTDAATSNAGTEIVSLVSQFGDVARAFMFTQQGLSLQMKDDAHHLLEEQLRDMRERLAELQEQIDKLSPTFEVEEKPR